MQSTLITLPNEDESELLSAITGRLHRFQHVLAAPETADRLSPAHASQPDGLHQFLDEARRLEDGLSLSADRRVHVLRKKQYVYSEGDEPTRLYFLKAGRVKAVKINADGKELITGLFNPGDFFGYVALLENLNYTDSAVTLDDVELIYMPKDDFRQLLSVNAGVSGQFIKLLAGRVAKREAQLLGMAYSPLRRRVADTLLLLKEQQPDGIIQLSRDDLAAMIGTATESLIRTLSEFRHDGLLEMTASGGIQVTQAEKLRRANW